ncbi:MAG: hypothetical protein DSZ31_03295, partial [Gammaproteobacteria bacterium]
FYKKLLWWKEFCDENKENRDEVLRQLKAIGTWLEKKIFCGGEPEIVNGEVVNFDEKKNLLNFVKVCDFVLREGEVTEKAPKVVGKVKKTLKPVKVASKGSLFEGKLEIDESYKELKNPSPVADYLKVEKLTEVLNRFSLKVLEVDKEFFVESGYGKTLKVLEEIEAESQGRLLKINSDEGVLPLGAEIFVYERLETPKGRKEYHHLNEVFKIVSSEGWAGEVFSQIRKISPEGYPFGWFSQI